MTIISTFFAGTLGGLIALGGIWWQLNHEKEEKKDRVLRYIKYIVQSNKNDERMIEDLLESERLIDYHNFFTGFESEERYQLKEFESSYIKDNINEMLKFSFCESVFDLEQKILDYNKASKYQWKNHYKRSILKEKFNKIKEKVEKSIYEKNILSIFYLLLLLIKTIVI